MGHAGADDRQTQRHVHRPVHPQQLQRDVALVVIHGHHGVEPPVAGPDHQRIGRQRPFEPQPLGQSALDGRADDRSLLVAEQPALAAVRIQRADADPRPGVAGQLRRMARSADDFRRGSHQPRHELMGQPGLGQNRLLGQLAEHVPQRRVQRDVDHGQAGRRQHLLVGPRYSIIA